MAPNLTDRQKLIVLAKILSKTEVVEFEDNGDSGAWIWVLCPFSQGTTWVAAHVLWDRQCECTNYSQGTAWWTATFEEVIEFLHVALATHMTERVRQAA